MASKQLDAMNEVIEDGMLEEKVNKIFIAGKELLWYALGVVFFCACLETSYSMTLVNHLTHSLIL
jgi:hypothetical protein